MLVTECKHCGARFRATPDQLNMRQGQVRCGQCNEVFNAFESVVRVPAATGRALPHATSVPAALAKEADVAMAPRAPQPEGKPDATPASLADILHPPQRPESPPREEKPARDSVSPPAFVSNPKPARPSRAWPLGVVLLALLLAMQVAYAFRAQLARNYPPLRPALEALCATAGCKVPWLNDEAALKLEDSEMLEVPGKPGQIALQARIRNMSPLAQEFPHLELTLTDITGQAAIRRVLRPADYLGRSAGGAEVMAPGSEALLSVRLETGRIHATGYELLLFYP
jgi:predicted Zn finger-like uncharacterized protein